MTHFAITRKGFDELVATLGRIPSPIWVNYGVLSAEELSRARSLGVAITDFTSDVSRNNAGEFEDALDTILQHHPDQVLWVEHGR
jgi:hypothetical protein